MELIELQVFMFLILIQNLLDPLRELQKDFHLVFVNTIKGLSKKYDLRNNN